MRVLCVCSRGNVRSVNMAYLLREACEIEAAAIGYNSSTRSIRHSLFGWADLVIVMDEGVALQLKTDVTAQVHREKIKHCLIGLDRSGVDWAFKHELLEDLKRWLEKNGVAVSGKPFVGGDRA